MGNFQYLCTEFEGKLYLELSKFQNYLRYSSFLLLKVFKFQTRVNLRKQQVQTAMLVNEFNMMDWMNWNNPVLNTKASTLI